MNNTYILVEPARKELTTAINDVMTFYIRCVINNCLSDDLKRKSIDVLMKINEVEILMDTIYHDFESVIYSKRVCDNFLNDARELQREMEFAVNKCF